MKLEDQVTSLDLAKKLKELGVKQESLFEYCIPENGIDKDRFIACKRDAFYCEQDSCSWNHDYIPAYTVAELYSLLYSYGICDILLDIEPEKLADHLVEKLCQTLKKK